MREIAVRELKASLSEVLRAVGDGEHIRVTVRGTAVADLVPVDRARGADELRALVTAGRIALPSRSLPERAPRLASADRSASSIVLAARAAER